MSGVTLFGGIERGDADVVCAVASSPVHIVDSVRIARSGTGATLAECIEFFKAAEQRRGSISALGFCSAESQRVSSDSTELRSVRRRSACLDERGALRSAFRVPVAFDTDVGAAARAELDLGAGRGLGSLAYVAVGNCIAGAVAPAGDPRSRLMQASMGHLPVERDSRDGDFIGGCPFHGDCLEGLASSAAIHQRWGCALESLPPRHEGREVIAEYLGQMVASIAMMLSVHRVVLGGDVMADGALLPLIHAAAFRYLNGYIPALRSYKRMTEYVCAPLLGSRARLAGALLLAETEYKRGQTP